MFTCPKCLDDSLTIMRTIELPPDNRSDEITLQIVECDRCEFRGAAVYQESRRGALDSESWEHIGYQVNSHDLNTLIAWINKCPYPRNPRCQCLSHQTLAQKDQKGYWTGLHDFDMTEPFSLQR